MLHEISQTQKDKYHMISLTCGIYETDTNELIYKTEIDSQTQRTDLWLPRKGSRGGKEWEFGISRGKLLYIGWINNKILLYSTGNNIQYPVTNRNGKEYEKNICITESLSCTEEINTTLQINYTSIKF